MNLPISTREAIERTDFALTNGVRQIKVLDAIKKELTRQSRYLSRALNATSAKNPDDLVYIPGGLDNPTGTSPASVVELEQIHRMERTWKRVLKMATVLELEHRKAVAKRIKAQGLFRLAEVQAELQQISERLAAIKRVTESVMLDLQATSRKVVPVPA